MSNKAPEIICLKLPLLRTILKKPVLLKKKGEGFGHFKI
jgi:hypothetical protein